MSEQSLDKLIQSLKTEAIDTAEKESARILSDAREEAEQIRRSAEVKREQIIRDAESEAQGIVEKGESALRQAARDVQVEVRNELLELFRSVLQTEVRKEFNADLIKDSISKVIANIGGNVELEISDDMRDALAEYIQSHVQGGQASISIRPDSSLVSGLSVKKADEGWSYEITPAEVADLLRSHLIDKWVGILEKPEAT